MYLALDDREDLPEKVLTEMKLTRKWVLAIVGDKWPLQHRHTCSAAPCASAPRTWTCSRSPRCSPSSRCARRWTRRSSATARGRATPTSSCAPSRASRQACRTRADRSADCLDERAGRLRADQRREPPRSRCPALDWPAAEHARGCGTERQTRMIGGDIWTRKGTRTGRRTRTRGTTRPRTALGRMAKTASRTLDRATDSRSSDVTRRLSAFTHAATPTAIVGLYNWFGQTYILGRLSLVHISLFLPRPAYNPNDNPFGYGFPS